MKKLLSLLLVALLVNVSGAFAADKTVIETPQNISEGEDGYISEDLLCALYGYGKLPEETKSWIDFSFYISSRAHPCEFAAVLCNSPSAAQDTAKLFCKRLDTLKNSWNNDELSNYLKNAEVVIIKNYVLLLVSADSENAKSIASEIIR